MPLAPLPSGRPPHVDPLCDAKWITNTLRQRGEELRVLCVGEPRELEAWLDPRTIRIRRILGWTILTAAIYGTVIGSWRAPAQALFVAIKFPLLIVLTLTLNGLVNGVLAWRLGLGIGWGQSFRLILISLTQVTILLASLSPVVLFLLFHLAAPDSDGGLRARNHHLLANVALIAIAGSLGVVRQLRLLEHLVGSAQRARRILIAWFLGNGFLGCQLSWNLRPFFGEPNAPVQFLRERPFDGSFYEAVLHIVLSGR